MVALFAGCSKTTTTKPIVDTTAPSTITTLAVTDSSDVSLTLDWLAPGDNGVVGTATSYDLRYSTSLISDANFSTATQVTGVPVPHGAGSLQSTTVTGLASLTTYYFAMKTYDEALNVSGLSNVAIATTIPFTGDTTAPAAIADLATTTPTLSSITVSWTAPGDDGAVGRATSYDLRYSTAPITGVGDFTAATQVSGEPSPAVAGSAQAVTVDGLAVSTLYYFAIRTSDEKSNVSDLSNVATGTTLTPPPDTTPPAAIADLSVVTSTSTSITLLWTAPGDDGTTGTATQYDLRYSLAPIGDDLDFINATEVTGEPNPAIAGTTEAMAVEGLTGATTYYFAIKTSDEALNLSGVSNSPSGTTLTATSARARNVGRKRGWR